MNGLLSSPLISGIYAAMSNIPLCFTDFYRRAHLLQFLNGTIGLNFHQQASEDAFSWRGRGFDIIIHVITLDIERASHCILKWFMSTLVPLWAKQTFHQKNCYFISNLYYKGHDMSLLVDLCNMVHLFLHYLKSLQINYNTIYTSGILLLCFGYLTNTFLEGLCVITLFLLTKCSFLSTVFVYAPFMVSK